ncbi:MAG: amidohydrolase [Actinobacteria bacterium]|nr:amidohydrolase [Actinomycetota bacterium]
MPELDQAINNARYLVTCNSSGKVFENYSIGIRAGEIVKISKSPLEATSTYDASGKLIAPGLINTHTHLAMTLLRGYAEGVDLQGFLERVWAAEGAIMDGSTAEMGTKLGALEALLSGTTTTLDMYLFPEDTHRGAVTAGLRHVAGPIFFDFPGLDAMEWPARIEFARSWPDKLRKIGGPQVPIYLMPHATYTCSPDHLTEIAALANEFDANIHIHISENNRENEDVATRYSRTPTDILKDSGLLNRHCVYGHGVHLSDSDLTKMSGNAAVAHCPGSNLKLSSGIADITKYLKHGITVALGTDGCSSSNDLDMWPVMRLAGYLIAQNCGPQNLEAERIFRMATIEGARALGMADSIGSLEVGKQADIIAVELNSPHLIPIHNLFAQLVFAAGRSDVSDVFVDGEQVVKNYQSTKLDFSQLQKDVTNRIAQL